MSFFAVLLALVIEQLKPLPRSNPVHDSLIQWVRWSGRNFDAGRERHAWVVWGVTVLAPSLAAWGVYLAIARFSLLGALVWNIAGLYVTLGFGPAGAVLYRMAEFASRYWAYKSRAVGAPTNDRLMLLSQRLFGLIDHLPARLTAFGFAVVGNFEEAVSGWRRDAALWKHA